MFHHFPAKKSPPKKHSPGVHGQTVASFSPTSPVQLLPLWPPSAAEGVGDVVAAGHSAVGPPAAVKFWAAKIAQKYEKYNLQT